MATREKEGGSQLIKDCRGFKQVSPVLPKEGGEAIQGQLLQPILAEQTPTDQETLKVKHVPFAGRLKFYLKAWSRITSNPTVLSWIQGYRIPFKGKPPSCHHIIKNNFPSSEMPLVNLAIGDLLRLGAIIKSEPSPEQFISPIFLADKPNGGKRFILNLKNLNDSVECSHFKMDDLRTAIKLTHKNVYMSKIDLKDAYFVVPIHNDHQKFLTFQVEGQLYQFTCLPFGLCTAPLCFTKLMKPVISHLRTIGISLVNYLDDILIFGESYESCLIHTNTTANLLILLGFVINESKSTVIPTTCITFLGFLIDSVNLKIKLPNEKKNNIIRLASHYLNQKKCKIRDLAKFIGILVAACPGVKYGFLYCKALEREKFLALRKYNGNYNAVMLIPEKVKSDILWWKNNTSEAFNDIRYDTFHITIFTDASLTGWGACCGHNRTHGFWSEPQRRLHINNLELLAIFHGIQCYAKSLKNLNVLIRCDNTTAVSYINRMGSIQFPGLCSLSKQIWQWCEERNLWLFASYIPSKDNAIADAESRRLSVDTEWSLSRNAFHQLTTVFGEPEIDLFASHINNKCKIYASWHKDPESTYIDAFTIPWNRYYFYAFPPFTLILRALQKIIQDKAVGILVVPWWPSQPWYSFFRKLIVGQEIYFNPSPTLLSSPFFRVHPLSKTLTLVGAKLSGRRF